MSNPASPRSLRKRAPIPKEVCALARAVEEIGDRWILLILREAFYGVVRYDDILADLGIPRSVLTDRLRKLVARGILEKRHYQETGDRRRFAYVLTDKGRGLATSLIALTQWSEAHILGGPGPADIIERSTGRAVRATLVTRDGDAVSAAHVAAQVRNAD